MLRYFGHIKSSDNKFLEKGIAVMQESLPGNRKKRKIENSVDG